MASLLQATVDRAQADGDFFDQQKLPELAKWATGGFGALAALLTFFGVKDGLLTRILNEDATASLWALLMLGAGLVLSAFGLAIKSTTYVKVYLIALFTLLFAGFTSVFLKDFGESNWATILLGIVGIGLLLFVCVAFVAKWVVPATAGLIVIASACTAMGLYSAAKISVEARGAPETLRVRVKLAGEGRAKILQISLTGSKQADGVVVVTGSRRGLAATRGIASKQSELTSSDVQVWRSYFAADENRSVSESYEVPVQTSRWSRLTVLTCAKLDKDGKEVKKDCDPRENYTFVGGRALDKPSIGGTLSVKKNQLTATLNAAALLDGEYVRMFLRPHWSGHTGREAAKTKQALIPDSEGAISWSQEVASSPGVRWTLRAAICVEGVRPCRKPRKLVAEYRQPRA